MLHLKLFNSKKKTEVKTRILILDDDKAFSKNFIISLKKTFGHSIDVLHLYKEDLQKINSFNPEIAIIEYQLNNCFFNCENGILISEKLKQIFPKLKTLIVSDLVLNNMESIFNSANVLFKDEKLITKIQGKVDNKIKENNLRKNSTIIILEDNRMFAKTLEKELLNIYKSKIKVEYIEPGEESIINHLDVKVAIIDFQLKNKYFDATNGFEIGEIIKNKVPKAEIILMSNLIIVSKNNKSKFDNYLFKDDLLVNNVAKWIEFNLK